MMRISTYLLTLLVLGTSATGLLAQTKSAKRGMCATSLSVEQSTLLAPGVSWTYNWGTSPGNLNLVEGIEYYPMVWRGEQNRLDQAVAYLDGGATPGVVLFSNEPNFVFPLGSFQTPQAVADWAKIVRSTLSEYNVQVIGPNMASGSSFEDSVTSFDECKGEEITYTSFDLYLDAFDCYNGEEPVEGIGVHPYSGVGEIIAFVDKAYERYGEPVWVTEFAKRQPTPEGTVNQLDLLDPEYVADMYAFMISALDYLERSDRVAGYSWFIANGSTQDGLKKVALVTSGGRGVPIQLTAIGDLYVNYPTYDPDFYFPVPGRIQAESYHEVENLSLKPAYNPEGMGALARVSSRQDSWVSFRLNVAEAGTYRMRMRISGDPTDFPDLEPDPEVTDPPLPKERDLYFTMDLEAGNQVQKVLLRGLAAKIDWVEFEQVL